MMLEFLSKLFPKRSKKNGERLTDQEIVKITESMDDGGSAKCPDCGSRLMGGPAHGNDDINAACEKCHSEFCLHLLFEECVGGMRISDRGPRSLGERASLYE